MDERLPQYLHKPVQILWFGSDEFVLMVTTIFVAVIVGGLVGWAFIAALGSLTATHRARTVRPEVLVVA